MTRRPYAMSFIANIPTPNFIATATCERRESELILCRDGSNSIRSRLSIHAVRHCSHACVFARRVQQFVRRSVLKPAVMANEDAVFPVSRLDVVALQ